MFEKKYYTRWQRKLYGLGWFAISCIIAFVFAALDWTVLGYIASAFFENSNIVVPTNAEAKIKIRTTKTLILTLKVLLKRRLLRSSFTY